MPGQGGPCTSVAQTYMHYAPLAVPDVSDARVRGHQGPDSNLAAGLRLFTVRTEPVRLQDFPCAEAPILPLPKEALKHSVECGRYFALTQNAKNF